MADESGNIEYNRKVRLTTPCSPDVMLFPFDIVTCSLMLSSFGYTANEVYYTWLRGSGLNAINFREGAVEREGGGSCTVQRVLRRITHSQRICNDQNNLTLVLCFSLAEWKRSVNKVIIDLSPIFHQQNKTARIGFMEQ